MRARELGAAYQVMSIAKMGKMTAADKAKAVKAYMAIKRELTALDELTREAEKRLRPERLTELEERAARLDAAERKELERLRKEYAEAMELTLAEEDARELTPEFEPLSQEAYEALVDGSDLNIAQASLLGEVLLARPKGKAAAAKKTSADDPVKLTKK